MAVALVLSTHALHARAAELIEAEATLQIAASLSPDALTDFAREADIVIVRAPLPPQVFSSGTRLRAAIRHGAGVDMIPIEAATAAGVLVANVPGANARSVAEYVMFCALALARRFRTVDSDFRAQGWDASRSHATSTTEISGKTLGLIGMGNVGCHIHALARAFDMRVIAFRRSEAGVPAGAELEPLDDVIREADFLVLCCPLTDATRGLIDQARLALMKPTAFLINAARGPIIVERDLVAALDAGRIAGAALDVFVAQPLQHGHPLFDLPNVLLTPHLAGVTDESMERMGIGAAHEALRVLRGELPENLVNPDALTLYRMRFGLPSQCKE